MRPKRLFGFDGTAGEDPCSSTGLMSLGGVGLSPATAAEILPDNGAGKLQGGTASRSEPPHPNPLPSGEREFACASRRVETISLRHLLHSRRGAGLLVGALSP